MEQLTDEQGAVLSNDIDKLLDCAFRVRTQVREHTLDKHDIKFLTLSLDDLMTFLHSGAKDAWQRRILNVVFGYDNVFDVTVTNVYKLENVDSEGFNIMAHIKLPSVLHRGTFEYDFIIHVPNPYMRSVFQSLVEVPFKPFELEVSCSDFTSLMLDYRRLLTAPKLKF